jgi:hypothetical protein
LPQFSRRVLNSCTSAMKYTSQGLHRLLELWGDVCAKDENQSTDYEGQGSWRFRSHFSVERNCSQEAVHEERGTRGEQKGNCRAVSVQTQQMKQESLPRNSLYRIMRV